MDIDKAYRVISRVKNTDRMLHPYTLADLTEEEVILFAEHLAHNWSELRLARLKHEEHKCPCLDCGVDTWKLNEYYMVTKTVWSDAFPDRPRCDGDKSWTAGLGYLCIGCLEKRIGRILTPSDFTNYPINHVEPGDRGKSPRLMNRLGYMCEIA